MTYESLAQRALDTATTRGAGYADVRFERAKSERIEVRNGEIAELADDLTTGYGIRAFVDGAWGFAASRDLGAAALDSTAARAVEIAKAGAAVAERRFAEAPAETYVDRFATPVERDPDDVPLGERVALLLDAERALHVDPRIAAARAWLDVWRTEKEFFSTTGSAIAQSLLQTGCGEWALAVDANDAQERTFPGDVGLYQSGGWEIVELAQLRENAARIGEEAVALLSAPQCPAGEMDVVLGGSQVSLQIHESCGHAAELDRVLGWEANFSGTSFLDPRLLGKLQYGSEHVTIVIDNTLPRGLATVGYDDEGARSVRSDIVRDGVLVGFEMSRDTARLIGRSDERLRARPELAARPDDSHVQPQPTARNDAVRRTLRRHQTRRVHGIESVVVDRRPPAQLPVRLRDRLGDRQRQARTDGQESDVRRRHAAFLELVRRDRRRALVGRVGDAELRQGRADADRAHHAVRGACALSQRRGRSRL